MRAPVSLIVRSGADLAARKPGADQTGSPRSRHLRPSRNSRLEIEGAREMGPDSTTRAGPHRQRCRVTRRGWDLRLRARHHRRLIGNICRLRLSTSAPCRARASTGRWL